MSDFMARISPPAPRPLPADEAACTLTHPDGRVFRFTTRTNEYGVELRQFVNDQFRYSQLYRGPETAQLRADLDAKIAELEARGWVRE